MPAARCLDITRLLSRLGRGPWTGVDRVEIAYLRALLDEPEPLFLITRTALGFILVRPSHAMDVRQRLEARRDWGTSDLVGHLTRRAHPIKRRAESDLRRWAQARCRHGQLANILRRHLPEETDYFNVGHSNLTDESLVAWRNVPRARVNVLVHDTIPLDFPQYQRPGTVESFRARLGRVSAHADRVIFSTRVAEETARPWFAEMGRTPESIVAHLGVDLTPPQQSKLPFDTSRPYFVTVGTIEPRKNHAFLLDVWEKLPDDEPILVIAGRRGWNNEQVFRRLDSSPMMGNTVLEFGDLDDAAISAALFHSRGLLFPSLAEGYGLPPIEAAALQVPVICNELPVYREVLGDLPVYLNTSDVYLWINRIKKLAAAEQARQVPHPEKATVPTWQDHFNQVLKNQ